MKIVAHLAGLEGCGYYRILVPYRELARRGHNVSFTNDPNDSCIEGADVLVLQRQNHPTVLGFVKRWQAMGTAFLLEFDDNMHTLSSLNIASQEYGNDKPATRGFERFLEIADAVTVSTHDLASEYARFRGDIYVCENALDDARAEIIAPAAIDGALKREGQVRIGWAGSGTHIADFLSIRDPLVKAMRDDQRIRFVTIGESFARQFPADLRARVEYAGHSVTDRACLPRNPKDELLASVRYYDLIASAEYDVAIAPIEHTTFNRCKSALKVMEYGALGIPFVASRFGPYARYASEWPQPVGMLVRGDREWHDALRRLANDVALRAELASENLRHVRGRRLISQNVDAWERALEAAVAKKAVAA